MARVNERNLTGHVSSDDDSLAYRPRPPMFEPGYAPDQDGHFCHVRHEFWSRGQGHGPLLTGGRLFQIRRCNHRTVRCA